MPSRFEFRFLIQGPEGSRRFMLPEGETWIGRLPENPIVLDHPRVSRRHARIVCTPGECQITDWDSSNGTLVDGDPLPPQTSRRLNPGSEVQIGPFLLVLEKVEPEARVGGKRRAAPVVSGPAVEVEKTWGGPPGGPAGEAVVQRVAHYRRPVYWEEEEALGDLPAPEAPAVEKVYLDPFIELDRQLNRETQLPIESRWLIQYLPEIYHLEDLDPLEVSSKRKLGAKQDLKDPQVIPMNRFLGVFESFLLPVKWTLDNFDLFLDPDSAPRDFLHWLAAWFGIVFQPGMSEAQERALLNDAHRIYDELGTSWALSRVLEIHTGKKAGD
jgi:phage tail-like protein